MQCCWVTNGNSVIIESDIESADTSPLGKTATCSRATGEHWHSWWKWPTAATPPLPGHKSASLASPLRNRAGPMPVSGEDQGAPVDQALTSRCDGFSPTFPKLARGGSRRDILCNRGMSLQGRFAPPRNNPSSKTWAPSLDSRPEAWKGPRICALLVHFGRWTQQPRSSPRLCAQLQRREQDHTCKRQILKFNAKSNCSF